MTLVPLRKAHAGSDSYGHVWPKDGSVVEVPYDEAMDLLKIPDAEFSVAEPDPEPTPVSEVDPDPEQPVDETPKRATRRRPA